MLPGDEEDRSFPAFGVAWGIVAMLTFFILGGTAQTVHLAWGIWFSQLLLLAWPAAAGFRLLGLRPFTAMGLQRFDARGAAWGFAFGSINYFAWAVPLMALAHWFFPAEMVTRFDSAHIFQRPTAIEVVIVFFGVNLAAPLGEEMFFRGFVQRAFTGPQGAPRAIAITAVLFSAFHLDPVGLLPRFELGLLFGLLAWQGRSLWPAIAAHAANNLWSSGLYFLGQDDASGEGELPWYVPLAMCVLGNIGLWLLARWSRGRLISRWPAEEIAVPPASGQRLFLQWAIAVAISVGLLLAVDFRGVQLNWVDAQSAPSAAVKSRDDVKRLREQVRRGEAAVEEYERLLHEVQLRAL